MIDFVILGVYIDQCNVFIIYYMYSFVCKKYYKYVIIINEVVIYRRYMQFYIVIVKYECWCWNVVID